MDLIREGLQHDPVAKSLITLAHEGKTRRFWVEDDLLFTKGKRLYVLSGEASEGISLRSVMTPNGLVIQGNDARGHY